MKLEIEITRQDYFNFNIYHYSKTRLTKTIIIATIGLVFLQFALNKDKVAIDVSMVIGSSLLYLIIYFLILYWSLNKTRRIPDDNGSMLGKKEFDFKDEYITYSDKDSNGQYNWSAIKSMGENKNSFYLYIDANIAIVIPKRYFIDKSQEKEFKEIILKNLTIA